MKNNLPCKGNNIRIIILYFLRVLKQIVEAGANKELADTEGHTALMMAESWGFVEVARLMSLDPPWEIFSVFVYIKPKRILKALYLLSFYGEYRSEPLTKRRRVSESPCEAQGHEREAKICVALDS